MSKGFVLSIYFLFLTNAISADKIALGKIYRNIESKYFCIRRLNATHSFGCQSHFTGNIGVLHPIKSNLPIDHSPGDPIIDNPDVQFVNQRGPTPPYIPVIDVNLITTQMMESFRDSGRVSGVIVFKRKDSALSSFSTDKSCPNDESGLYSSLFNSSFAEYDHCSKQKWNSPDNPVSGLFYRDFSFPVILIEKEDDINSIEKCISNYGTGVGNYDRSWPLCSAELYVHMNAAKDAKTCMRRNSYSVQIDNSMRYCDPMGSFNVFNPLIPINPNNSVPERTIHVLASRLDSFSFFFDKTPGADSPATSITVLLSIAETLGKIRDQIHSQRKSERNLMFALFNGESFDYIGSGRTVYDLLNGQFIPLSTCESPFRIKALNITSLKLSNLANFIELTQLAPHNSSKIYLHTDPLSTRDPGTSAAVEQMISQLKGPTALPFERSAVSKPLPPASLQSFLRGDIKLPGVVLANHDGIFENKYYNSFVDDGQNIGLDKNTKKDSPLVKHLTALSTQISQAMYTILTNETDTTIASDSQTITDLLHCFVVDASCPLFVKHGYNISSPSPADGPVTYPFYISVRQQFTSSFFLMRVISQILATFTGNFLELNEDQCKNQRDVNSWLSYHYIPDLNTSAKCVESQVFATDAVSPVFMKDEPDWSLPYSTWTESVWDQPSVRIFLQPGPNQEWYTLTAGLLITLFSFFAVRFIRNKSRGLFKLPNDNNGVSLMTDNNADC